MKTKIKKSNKSNYSIIFSLVLVLSLLTLSILIISPSVSAMKDMQGHIKLLAVSEGNGNMTGSIADLYLKIEPGHGSVYIDTFPLTKMDTQLSTRFAKEVACRFLDAGIDCRKYDFFYTIKADSPIIGGPSAGAALAMLTVALLDPEVKNIDESVSITGTINTGGIIGSVGGVKEKIAVSGLNNITKVLVPLGSFHENNETKNSSNLSLSVNSTDVSIPVDVSESIDLVLFGKEHGVEVIEVLTLADALKVYTGKDYSADIAEITKDDFYAKTMSMISGSICSRAEKLRAKLSQDITSGKGRLTEAELANDSFFNKSIELLGQASNATQAGQTYAAASYCFGANINYDYLILLNANLSKEEQKRKIEELGRALNNSNLIIDKMNITSFNDIQTYLIVKERLIEAQDLWEEVAAQAEKNTTDLEYGIAYVTERLFSAYSWSNFFNRTETEEEQSIVVNEQVMEESCKTILSEAQERLEYFRLLFPYGVVWLEQATTDIDRAYENYDAKNFRLCLMHSTKAKADIDAVLSTLSLDEPELERLLDAKLKLAKQTIAEQQSKGFFPIQGYSYYEYGKALGANDKVSGLIYSQYALEFSNLDLYFERTEKVSSIRWIIMFAKDQYKLIISFFIGFGCAVILYVAIKLWHAINGSRVKKKIKKAKH